MSGLLLTEQYILYIDLLGYKEKIKEESEINFLKTIDKSYIEAIKTIRTMEHPANSQSVFDYRVFSDNIIVATNADNIGDLYSLSYIAYLLQRTFIKSYILCRGSITKGQLHINPEYVFGSGLIYAYELENTVAFYPRIIIDRIPESETLIQEYDIYRQDGDGYIIIDYLRMRKIKYDPRSALLVDHKSFIMAGLERYNENERFYQKYAWCREYHNSICKQFDLPEFCI